ncbi:uncharacterized protein [Choristoneura fumiferana]|uniref:uncharacterized protein n=1 Tax=Choristoneura fumiferana TaxID=7141 RepID=UPI003D15764E
MSKNSKVKGKSNDDTQFPDVLSELRQLRLDISDMKEKNTEISLLRQEVQELRDQISSLSDSLTDKHLQFVTKMEQADIQIATLKYSVTQLQQQLSAQEQHAMKNELEIIGVPESDTENLTNIVLTASQIIGVQLQETDLDDVIRAGPKRPKHLPLNRANEHKPRPIIVKLLRRQKRDEIIKAAKSRRNLTTENIVPGAVQKLYVNERLSKENRLLFREARLRASAHNFKFCWVRNGAIYVRENENKPGIRISSAGDLDQKVGPSASPST